MMRQLTEILHEEEAGVIYSLLLSLHVEIYTKKKNSEEYNFVDDWSELKEGAVYVPNADYDFCSDELKKAGYDSLVCKEQERESLDENEKIIRDFERKRRWHMIEWGLVIGAVILFQLIRSLFL